MEKRGGLSFRESDPVGGLLNPHKGYGPSDRIPKGPLAELVPRAMWEPSLPSEAHMANLEP